MTTPTFSTQSNTNNFQPIHHINFDIQLLGDCDVIVAELARRAGWELKHDMLPADQTVDVVTIDEEEHEYSVKLRNAAPVVQPQGELKMEAARRMSTTTNGEATNANAHTNGDAKAEANHDDHVKENGPPELKTEVAA